MLAALAAGSAAQGAPLVVESFNHDPIASGRAQVVGSAERYAYQPGSLVAHYDTGQATTSLLWPLGYTLNQNTSFEIRAEFTIKSAGFFAKANDFAQLSFGLLNSVTTGPSRTGGNAYDFVGLDYFPNTSTIPSFDAPALGPAVIQSNNGQSFFSRIEFPFGGESGLKPEGPLPLDAQLTASLYYHAPQRILTLTMSDADGPLDINSSGDLGDYGGLDGDISTIQLLLPWDAVFSVDRLAIPLWSIPAFSGGGSVLTADILFDLLRVDVPWLVPGDANFDGVVDSADYTIWADHYLLANQTVGSGDFNGDGVVDGADYTVWADHYSPQGASLAAVAVPEPAALLLAGVGILAISVGAGFGSLRSSAARRLQTARRPHGNPPGVRCEEAVGGSSRRQSARDGRRVAQPQGLERVGRGSAAAHPAG